MLKSIFVTYGHTTELEVSIGSFLLQDNPDWEMLVVHDGAAPKTVHEIMSRYRDDPRIKFTCTLKRNGKYGHINRRYFLNALMADEDDWVLLSNSDNYYCPQFISQMMEATKKEDAGIIFCDTIHSHLNYGYHSSILKEGGLDMGCFIIRADVAKHVGFTKEHFSADGFYAEECAKECARRGLVSYHITHALFIHN